jgi:hypothetical protein
MVEEKARVVLKKSEFATLAYYQEEYAARQMTIEAFVAVLLELLNTSEKVKFHFFLFCRSATEVALLGRYKAATRL